MRCETCANGDRRVARRPYVTQRGSRIAVVTDVPVEECPSCGEIWFAEPVALRLDDILNDMLAHDVVAVRPFTPASASAA